MVRTQIYLTEEERAGLESVALAQGKKQSEIIRQAIDDLLAHQGPAPVAQVLAEVAGVWAERNDLPDIRSLRTGWRGRPGR